MTMQRRVKGSIVLAALVGIAPVAAAQWGQQFPRQSQELFEWRGSVDREVQIVMRGDRVWTNNVGRTEPNNERSRTMTPLPRRDGEVVLQVADGRGRIEVIQQPSARNAYTTIVRIQDPRAGSDAYRLAAYWRGYADGDIYRRSDDRSKGRRGDEMGRRDRDNRDDDWDNDGAWDRDRDRRESVLRWSGNVDDELEIRLQNGRVEYRTIRGAQPTSIRTSAGNAANRRNGTVLGIAENHGRGTVVVTQQPSMWNNNTTVIRVRDPQGGFGHYDFDLIWR